MTDRAYKYLPGITNMQITIKADHGYASWQAWVTAGMPGAVSFAHPKTSHATRPQQGNEWKRRGLCRITTCKRVAKIHGWCMHHWGERNPVPQSPYIPQAVRIAREKAR